MSEEDTAPHRFGDPAIGRETGPALASEISRRVAAILDAVEREASRLREEARADAARYLDDARRHADALVAERQRRIAAVSDELLRKSEAVVTRLDDAAPVREGFEHLVRALGDAAERLSFEADRSESGPAPPAVPSSFHETWVPPAAQPPPPAPQQSPPAPEPPLAPPSIPAPPVPAPPQQPSGGEPVAGPPPASPAPAASPANQPAVPPTRHSRRDLDDARVVAIQMAAAGRTRAEVRDHLAAVLGIIDSAGTLDEVFGEGSGEGQRVPWTGSPG